MGSENREITRYDITSVYTHADAKVDIVLVHGLNGSPEKTWTAKNGTFWPLDLLPTSLKGVKANVMVYGYNADVYSKRNDRSASDNFIYQHAQTLVTTFMYHRLREGTFKNPIIWVCHSLGGILVKRALLYSADLHEPQLEDHRSIFVSTYGLVFLGTPHTGADAATWAHVLQAMSDAIMPKKFYDSESVLLRTLKKDNETLANINNHFLDIYQRFRIHMVHENQKTDIKASKAFIVDVNSASPQLPGVTYYGIEATHSGMCKFEGMSSPGFRNISAAVQKWALDAPSAIEGRWKAEEDERRARTMIQATELMSHVSQAETLSPGPSQPDPVTSAKDEMSVKPTLREMPRPALGTSNEPIFVHPERFRPNSFFKGREHELNELHEMLMDKKRQKDGTSAVLIWSVPGGGKTHLAREYAFKHRHNYPGGVFWVRAKAPEDLEDGFLRIAKHAISRGEIEIQDEEVLQDLNKVIPLVRDWLNRSEKWLLILDGGLHDTPDLADCIPDAPNTSMILTSTDTSIAGDHKFNNPQKLELGPLDEEAAQTLLLEEMDRKRPWTQDDLARAREVTQLTECLPLAIHAAAGQMRATREPLSKYIRSYRKRPRAGGLGAYKAVREKLEERGETAALNLMYLLSFFGGRVPVEMLALGLTALDKRTPVRTRDSMGKRSLNKTFTVLIAFALIERDEVDEVPSASSPDTGRTSMRPTEPLDVLKIHGIVQSFFLAALKQEGQFDFWLERAVTVFLKSFEEGDRRARDNLEMGLPDDYRRYLAHCRKMLKHIKGIEKPTRELIAAENALESRFRDIQGHISTLARTMTTESAGGWGQGPHVSVFERTNSASLSSSVATVDGAGIQDGQQSLRDPQAGLPTLGPDPHHYHIPYPDDSTIPAPPEFLEDDDRADVSHRTVRGQSIKRYHDRAGSWRETTQQVSEPRVSISRELVLGEFSPTGSTLASPRRTSTISSLGAEDHLHLIQHASQLSPKVSELDKNRREAFYTTPNGSGVRTDLDVVESGATIGSFGGRSLQNSSLGLQSQRNIPQRSREPIAENPFFEGSSSVSADAHSSMNAANMGNWRSRSQEGRISVNGGASRSDTSLDSDIGVEAPGLPIINNSTSSLRPSTYNQQPLYARRRAGFAGEGLSSSLPTSNASSTLRPSSWRASSPSGPGGYSSQPMSRNPSSNPELVTSISSGHYSPTISKTTSHMLPFPIQTHRAPSTAATEPSPRLSGTENAPITSYQAWQLRHADPWSHERASRRDFAPRSSHTSEGVEMVRSGSGGIHFNGHIVEFGHSPPTSRPKSTSPTVGLAYPQEIAETASVLKNDEIVTPLRRPVGLGIAAADPRRRGQF